MDTHSPIGCIRPRILCKDLPDESLLPCRVPLAVKRVPRCKILFQPRIPGRRFRMGDEIIPEEEVIGKGRRVKTEKMEMMSTTAVSTPGEEQPVRFVVIGQVLVSLLLQGGNVRMQHLELPDDNGNVKDRFCRDGRDGSTPDMLNIYDILPHDPEKIRFYETKFNLPAGIVRYQPDHVSLQSENDPAGIPV